MTESLRFHRLSGSTDPLFPAWLDAIQMGFPPDEQMRMSFYFRAADGGTDWDLRLYAALDEQDALVGIAMYELLDDVGGCFLWYLWVDAGRRSQGVGSRLFGFVREQAAADLPGLRAIVWEVERPDAVPGHHERALAERRITFYTRLGARVARNVVYHSSTDRPDQLPRLMYLCLLPAAPLADEEAGTILREVFGHGMEPVDRIVLS